MTLRIVGIPTLPRLHFILQQNRRTAPVLSHDGIKTTDKAVIL